MRMQGLPRYTSLSSFPSVDPCSPLYPRDMLSSHSSSSSKARGIQAAQPTRKLSRGMLLVAQVRPMHSQLKQATRNLLKAATSRRSRLSSTHLLVNTRSMQANLLPRQPRPISSLPSSSQLSTRLNTPLPLQLQHQQQLLPSMLLHPQVNSTAPSTPLPPPNQPLSSTGLASSTSMLQVQLPPQASSTLQLLLLPTQLLHRLVAMAPPLVLAPTMPVKLLGSTAVPSSSHSSTAAALMLPLAQQLQGGMDPVPGSTAVQVQCTPQTTRAPSRTLAGLVLTGEGITSPLRISTGVAATVVGVVVEAVASAMEALPPLQQIVRVAMGTVTLGETGDGIHGKGVGTAAMVIGVAGMGEAGTAVVAGVPLLGLLGVIQGVGPQGQGGLQLRPTLQRGPMGPCLPHPMWIE